MASMKTAEMAYNKISKYFSDDDYIEDDNLFDEFSDCAIGYLIDFDKDQDSVALEDAINDSDFCYEIANDIIDKCHPNYKLESVQTEVSDEAAIQSVKDGKAYLMLNSYNNTSWISTSLWSQEKTYVGTYDDGKALVEELGLLYDSYYSSPFLASYGVKSLVEESIKESMEDVDIQFGKEFTELFDRIIIESDGYEIQLVSMADASNNYYSDYYSYIILPDNEQASEHLEFNNLFTNPGEEGPTASFAYDKVVDTDLLLHEYVELLNDFLIVKHYEEERDSFDYAYLKELEQFGSEYLNQTLDLSVQTESTEDAVYKVELPIMDHGFESDQEFVTYLVEDYSIFGVATDKEENGRQVWSFISEYKDSLEDYIRLDYYGDDNNLQEEINNAINSIQLVDEFGDSIEEANDRFDDSRYDDPDYDALAEPLFYGAEPDSEEAKDILFAIKMQYGIKNLRPSSARLMMLSNKEIQSALNYVNKNKLSRTESTSDAANDYTRIDLLDEVIKEVDDTGYVNVTHNVISKIKNMIADKISDRRGEWALDPIFSKGVMWFDVPKDRVNELRDEIFVTAKELLDSMNMKKTTPNKFAKRKSKVGTAPVKTS